MDIAVNLVESYLRLCGYLTDSEFDVLRRNEQGSYESATDIDVLALRIPGQVYVAGDPHGEEEGSMLAIDEDEALQLEPDLVDVIVGEVKESEAVLNPGLKEHKVLHGVLRRLEWLYGDSLPEAVESLQARAVAYTTSQDGAELRTRLVAFGRSPLNDLHTISLSYIVEQMMAFFERFDEVIRPTHYKDPAPALLRLLVKSGFSVRKLREAKEI